MSRFQIKEGETNDEAVRMAAVQGMQRGGLSNSNGKVEPSGKLRDFHEQRFEVFRERRQQRINAVLQSPLSAGKWEPESLSSTETADGSGVCFETVGQTYWMCSDLLQRSEHIAPYFSAICIENASAICIE